MRWTPRALLVAAALGVVGAVLVMLLVLRLTKVEGAKVKLADPVFRIKPAARYARDIADHGPLLFQDPLARSRDIVLQHQGEDPTTGWLAFEARLPDEPACRVTLDRRTKGLTDCHGRAVAADGAGLVHYPVRVVKGTVEVDLRITAQ